ncbi:MAG: 1-deoxy-D-xylulose 5-phosphate synthase [Brockia lithotrophica]|uniref:1-deoxy-D-xylulose-5-phosphate synthase n=1 Tax=Brockia lithotrophica TaxID=933949 RepID=A0A2T5G674_9BACL|nr:MAG: 1-deoxy-D-xylulose 5-phosphate synthase [Brockia lithotrophica]
MGYLEKIQGPDDVRSLPLEALPELAREIRERLIHVVARTGGHLAPNLGVVELTIMLHRHFRSPEDKLVWDVGHQGYVHKILTGRNDRLPTLRQYGGLSGFLKRAESEHDVWEAGHTSTSLSAALGMVVARDLRGEKGKVVAIIGDGALTAGMAYEALNQIGHLRADLLIVLNDNEMSISPNVGAISHYLTKLRTHGGYLRTKEEIEQLLLRLPQGKRLTRMAERVKESLKALLVPGVLFEEMGIRYFGPVDGHDFSALDEAFGQVKRLRGPVLLHVVTKKGRGYPAAEKDADTFHGIGPYKVESGEPIRRVGPPSFASFFARHLIRLAERDPRIVAITPAMVTGSGLKPFQERFPDRLFDVGIAEQHAVTFAAGLANAGMKPVAVIYSTFLQRAYDQVVHDVAVQRQNVVLAIDRAGLVGGDGETHHGVFDIAFLRTLPNVVLAMPKDENELGHLLFTAVRYDGGPFALRYPRGEGVGVPLDEEYHEIPIGSWEVLREGRDLVLLAVGPNMIALGEKVAQLLARRGLSVGLVNARFIKPLDRAMLAEFAAKRIPVATLEEASAQGGFGSAVLEALAEADHLEIFVRAFGLPDRFISHGSVSDLLRDAGLVPERIADVLYARLRGDAHSPSVREEGGFGS